MAEEKNCCGYRGGNKGDMSEWKEKYEKMNDSEKMELLEKKMKHLQDKLVWVEEEMGKLKK